MTYQTSKVLQAVVNSSWNSSDKVYHYAKVITALTADDILERIDEDMQKKDVHRYMRGIQELRSVISEALEEEAGVTIAEQLAEDLRMLREVRYPFLENFQHLLRANLVHLLTAFSSDFRGEITQVHTMSDHIIIQTLKDRKQQFYFVEQDKRRLNSNFSENLDQTLLMSFAYKYKDLDAANYAARVLNFPTA